jgi:nucleotide-binding universal stress UspA family protein
MIERVVVPVDFTPESDRALVVAATLADWAGATIDLVTVAEPDDRSAVEPKLAETAERVGHGTTWRVVDSSGPPGRVLVTELRRDVSALWCVGSHARGALGELIVGSLSEDLVREAHAPVVLVGPHARAAPSGRVLAVALDGTEQSEGILPVAADLAGALGMSLRLLQVGEPGSAPPPPDVSETAYLSSAAAKVPSIDRRAVDYDVLHGGHPAHNLADHVAAHPEVGMVALATRGLSGGARLLHRSTAFELAHRAVVAVVVLHHD